MKNQILFLLLFLINFKLYAQSLPTNINLIPNSSFEFNSFTTALDTTLTNSKFCWINPTNLNALNIKPSQVPYYVFAPKPRTGKKYAEIQIGFPSYAINTNTWIDTPIVRPYFETKLLQPLIANKTYCFTVYVGASKIDSALFQNYTLYTSLKNIGVHFSDTLIKDFAHNVLPNNIHANLNFTNWDIPYLDSFGYVKLSATYTAHGGEQYLTIGNFDDVHDFKIFQLNPNIIHNDTVPGTIFYTFFDDASLVADTTKPMINLAEFTLPNDTTICQGDTLTIGGQPNFFHYDWNTGDTSQFIKIAKTGTYICTVDYGCSTTSDTINITVLPTSKTTIYTPIYYSNLPIILQPFYSMDTYLWNTNQTSSTINITDTSINYWCIGSNACGSIIDSFILKYSKTQSATLYFPTAFSPNGDNVNEEFKPLGNTDNVIEYSVYNRWGNKVYESTNAQIGWKGVYNGIECTLGTYFYFCKYKENNEVKILKGSVELVR